MTSMGSPIDQPEPLVRRGVETPAPAGPRSARWARYFLAAAVLGSRAPLIKRADLGEKGVYYRAMVGPFASSEEAAQVCGNLKTAGGQCVVQKN